MIVRLALLLLVGAFVWRLLRPYLQGLQQKPPASAPPQGFTPDTDPMVRCEQCGVRVPSSQVATVRANCKRCNP